MIYRSGKPTIGQDIFTAPGTILRKTTQSCLIESDGDPIRPNSPQPIDVSKSCLEAGNLVDVDRKRSALFFNRALPTRTPPRRLILPLEKMSDQHGEAAVAFFW